MEECVDAARTPKTYKIAEVLKGLRGSPLSWWRCYKLYNSLATWSGFVRAILTRFLPNVYEWDEESEEAVIV